MPNQLKIMMKPTISEMRMPSLRNRFSGTIGCLTLACASTNSTSAAMPTASIASVTGEEMPKEPISMTPATSEARPISASA